MTSRLLVDKIEEEYIWNYSDACGHGNTVKI